MLNLTEISILKSRSGVYQDTPENRRLHRVGMKYGANDKSEKNANKQVDTSKISTQIKELREKRKNVEMEMEEELAQLGDKAINDGNNPVVKRYGSMLDKIDSKISELQSKIKPERKRVWHSYEAYMKDKPVEGEDYHYE